MVLATGLDSGTGKRMEPIKRDYKSLIQKKYESNVKDRVELENNLREQVRSIDIMDLLINDILNSDLVNHKATKGTTAEFNLQFNEKCLLCEAIEILSQYAVGTIFREQFNNAGLICDGFIYESQIGIGKDDKFRASLKISLRKT